MSAVGIEARIAEALWQHLEALVIMPDPVPVAWENAELPDASPYLAAALFPAPTAAAGIGVDALNRHQGTLQISVYVPAGTGTGVVDEYVSQVIAHFARGTDIPGNGLVVSIGEPPSPRGGVAEPGWFFVPVSIAWHCDTPNP